MNETRFHQLFDSVVHPVWLADPVTLRLLASNSASTQRLGYEPEQYLSMSLTDLLPPTECGRLDLSIAGLAGMEKASAIAGIFRVRLGSGTLVELELFTCPVTYGHREVLLVLAHEVTDREELQRTAREAFDHGLRQLAGELHDGLGQELTGLVFLLGALKKGTLIRDRESAVAVERAEQIAQRALDTCRGISRTLRPAAASSRELGEMLRELVNPYDSPCGPTIRLLTTDGAQVPLPADSCTHLFRIVQEAFANALRHSGAKNIMIALDVRSSLIRLEIVDDGRGLAQDVMLLPGLGLRTMRFRAGLIGGRLSFLQREPCGTRVLCELPLLHEPVCISYESNNV